MFDINEKDILGQTNKLLYNIWQELKSEKIPEIKTPVATLKCKICGTEHENKGSLMACYKKHKKG
jgi:hypothetical protein